MYVGPMSVVYVLYRLLYAKMDLDQTWNMYLSSPGKNTGVVSYPKTNSGYQNGGMGAGPT